MLLVAKPQLFTMLKKGDSKMKIVIAKMVLCMGLLLVLLGESGPRLLVAGGGEPPATGPKGALSVVS
jgi:hypothetical protein